MKSGLFFLLILGCSTIVSAEWKQLPSLPDQEGFAGMFGGVSNGALVVAGGANFPDKKPSEGGAKVWYDQVFVLEALTGKWQQAGRLPRPLGYGVSVTHSNRVICVGGSDAKRHYAEVFQLEWRDGELLITQLPSLPKTLANATGALVGATLYICGGQEHPDSSTALKNVWQLDLSAKQPAWQEIEACPGAGRILAVAAGCQGKLWVVGGAELSQDKEGKVKRRYLTNGYSFASRQGWQKIEELPFPVVAPPSPAPADARGFYILGGDDGSQLDVTPAQHQGFGDKMLRYEVETDRWTEAGKLPAPRVTTPCVIWNQAWILPSGEQRPGVRSPEVWAFIPDKKE